jgi:hypothetical protein
VIPPVWRTGRRYSREAMRRLITMSHQTAVSHPTFD